MAQKFSKPTELVQEDALLRFTVRLGGGASKTEHYILTAVAFQGGMQKAVQSYIKLADENAVEDDDGLVLRLFSIPHVANGNTEEWPNPINRADQLQAGSLLSLSTTQLAAHLVQLDCALGALDSKPPAEITIQRCKYDDLSRSTVRVTGIVDDWETITIAGNRDCNVVVAPNRKGKGKGKNKRQEQESETDFLEFVDLDFGASDSKSGRSRNQTPTVETSKPADSIDELGLHQELLSQLMDAFDVPIDKRTEGHYPKWRDDFEGLLDPDQLEALQAAQDASGLLKSPTSTFEDPRALVSLVSSKPLFILCHCLSFVHVIKSINLKSKIINFK